MPVSEIDELVQKYQKGDVSELPDPDDFYLNDPWAFVHDLCFTNDEMGRTLWEFPHPQRSHSVGMRRLGHAVDDIINRMLIEQRWMLSKSRRMLATWITTSMMVWLLLGGGHKRWTGRDLLPGTSHRQLFCVGRKEDSSVYFLEKRYWYIIENIPLGGDGPHWTTLWPSWTLRRKAPRISNSFHNLVDGVAQGADQLRGPGALAVHVEEFAFHDRAEETFSGLAPTTKGGGHIWGVTTPCGGTFGEQIYTGDINQVREKAAWL